MPRRKTPKPIAQGLHDRIRAQLDALGWTPIDVWTRLHDIGASVSRSTVGAWFSKGVVPDAWLLLLTCRVLQIDIEWALTGEGSSSPRNRQDRSEAERRARLHQISAVEAFLHGERAALMADADAAARALGAAAGDARAQAHRAEAAGLVPPLPQQPDRPARAGGRRR